LFVFVDHAIGRRHDNSRASVILLQSDGGAAAAFEMLLKVLEIAHASTL